MTASDALRRIAFIVNPVSGTQEKQRILREVQSRLSGIGIDFDIKYTRFRGHATELAHEAVEYSYDTVVAVGGDGTVNEVASALTHTKAALGIIPCGSGNGLARHLKIPLGATAAIDVIIEGKREIIDYCTFNGRKFFCTFGMGFDAVVASRFAQQKERGFGNYLKSAFEVYKTYTPSNYTIEADGKIYNGEFFSLTVGNASQYGNNAYIAPQASLTDGLLDGVFVKPGNIFSLLMLTEKLFTHTIRDGRQVDYVQAKRIVIVNETLVEFAAHFDGEPMRLSGPVTVECIPAALPVIIPHCPAKM